MAVNLRNKPVDRRRLSAQDKESYKPRRREAALRRVKQWRGNQAWQRNSPKKTQTSTPGTGGFTGGLNIQQERMRKEGAKVERSKMLRSEKI